jgi:mycoredoxin
VILANIKRAFAYFFVLAVGLGIGTLAPKVVEGLKPTYSVGNFASYFPDSETRVVVFGTSTCPYCAATRDYLKQRNIKFLDLDVNDSETGRKQFAELNGRNVPMILIGERRIVGFRVSVLDKALKAAGIISRN